MPDSKTAVLIDETYLRHVTAEGHPERADRIRRLLDHRPLFEIPGVVRMAALRAADRDDLLLVHTPEHIDRVAATRGKRRVALEPDTITCEDSYDTALFAAGGTLDMVDAIMRGDVENGFALVRPPGHHAGSDRAMGFCLFNNVAIAARYLQKRHGLGHILVVDWDVHHGNGTQQIFYGDDSVLFVSLHQFPLYPGTGAVGEVGEGAGEGFTVNVPMPSGVGDEEYLAAFHAVVEPVAEQFAPEFVLISAGFDGHRDDPLSGRRLTHRGYSALPSILRGSAGRFGGGRLAAVLEGGYNLEALARSVEAVVGTMSGGVVAPDDDGHPAARPAPAFIDRVRGFQSRFWHL